MLATILLLAAEEGPEASKTPFYVAGGLLAVWAVVVAALGLSRPEFPRTQGAERGVMALSALLVALTMAASVITS
jgi:hypothetical protein